MKRFRVSVFGQRTQHNSKLLSCSVLRACSFFGLGAAILLYPNSEVLAQPQTKHLVTFDDLETLKQADYLQLSPNGERLVYTINGDLWLVGTKQGSFPSKLGKGAIPTWSPDGKRLAYYSSESGTFQLWMRDMESRDAEQVTHLDGGINPDPLTRLSGWGTDPSLYKWSPDGMKLAFASQVLTTPTVSVDQNSVDIPSPSNDPRPLVLTTTTPPGWTLSGIFRVGGFGDPRYVNGKIDFDASPTAAQPSRVSQLFIVDTITKRLIQLTNDAGAYFNPNWSPDGLTIVCASPNGRSLQGYGPDTVDIFAVDVLSGNKRILTRGPGQKNLPSWSPNGRWIAYLGREKFGKQSVYVIPSTGGNGTNLTASLDRTVVDFRWNHYGEAIVLNYWDGVSWPIAQVDVPTGRIQQVGGQEQSVRTQLTVSRSGTIAWQQNNGTSNGVIYVIPAGRTSSYALIDLNPQLQEWRLGPQEVVRWKNSRGAVLEGILIKPADYRMGQKYPLIVDAYPNQSDGFYGWAMLGNQAWASQGYVIFWPNARTPHAWMNPFKSDAYDQAARGPMGWDVTVDDVMSGVDELIRRGIVDAERMGLYGFSNGGAIVDQLVTRTGRFKCAVSVAAALSADWGLTFFLQTMNPMVPTIAGTAPWKEPQSYLQLSAVYRLDQVTTPLLLADGDNDSYYLLNSIEMYNGLRYLGRDVTFLRYPEQGHGFTDWALKDFCERENAFFRAYLRPLQPVN